MKKTILLGMLAVLAATNASAKNVAYGLIGSDGTRMCETISLNEKKSGIAVGNVTCDGSNPAGGFYGNARTVAGPAWTVVFRESAQLSARQFVIVLDEKNLRWTAFSQADAASSYALLTAGTLALPNSPHKLSAYSLTDLLKNVRKQKPADPANGITVHYTFAGSGGEPFCDGLTLTETNNMAVGMHTSNSVCPQNHYAGGNYGHVKAIGEKVWSILTTDTSQPTDDLLFVIDENNMTWTEYSQGNTPLVAPFAFIDSGVLLLGDPID